MLTLSWRRPLSYRNQSIYLLHKSMDWCLYDNGLPHERIKDIRFNNINKATKWLWGDTLIGVGNEFTWNSPKKKFLPKKLLISENHFLNEKFLITAERSNHLTHSPDLPRKNISTQKIIIVTRKTIFKMKKTFTPIWKKGLYGTLNWPTQKRNFTQKITYTFPKNLFFT